MKNPMEIEDEFSDLQISNPYMMEMTKVTSETE